MDEIINHPPFVHVDIFSAINTLKNSAKSGKNLQGVHGTSLNMDLSYPGLDDPEPMTVPKGGLQGPRNCVAPHNEPIPLA